MRERIRRCLRFFSLLLFLIGTAVNVEAAIPRLPELPVDGTTKAKRSKKSARFKNKSSGKSADKLSATPSRKNSQRAGGNRQKGIAKAGASTVSSLDQEQHQHEKLLNPGTFVKARVQKLYAYLMSRPPRVVNTVDASFIQTPATKGPWLASLYSRNLVDAASETEILADKLIMARVLARALGNEFHHFYPKTLGVKEFLYKHSLVDSSGRISSDGDKIETALFAEFPAGFVVRPAVGVAPKETRRGLFTEGDEFVLELLGGESSVHKPWYFANAVKSHILGDVASGEAVILQDDIIFQAEAKKQLRVRTFREVRIHTYENNVIEDGIPNRWVQEAKIEEQEVAAAERFVNSMLRLIPPRLLTRQAWGVDVAVFDNGEMIVTDIVTNRGRRIQWSSYLEQPSVMGAYSRHFEKLAGVKFEGFSGILIRHNLGNYFSYWDTRIEKSKPGWSKLFSYLPPLP